MTSTDTNTPTHIHFAHANGFPASSYRKLFSFLPEELQIHAVEKFAHNPEFPVTRNWQGQVDELCHFLREEVGHPVYGVGHSFGAVITYMAACKHPALFKGIVLLDPPLITGITRHMVKLIRSTPLMDRVTPAHKAVTRCIEWPSGTDMVDYFTNKALFKNMDSDCIADYVEAAIEEGDEGFQLGFSHHAEADIFRNVPTNIKRFYGKLQVPALLVTGEKSNVCLPTLIKPFIKHNHMQHVEVKKGGHMFPLESPQQVANIIAEQISGWSN